MSNDVFTKDELLEIRRNRAIESNKGNYGYFGKTEQRKYKMGKDKLTKSERKRIDAIKERINRDEHDNVDLW